MQRAALVICSGRRRPITRRDWKGARRRGRRRRVWVGSRARSIAARPFFLALSAQQVRRGQPADWLGAGAMLLGMASWSVLAALLGG
jgi:hypothetical protein